MTELRHRFPIDRAWVKRREAFLIAWEDAIIRAVRDRATGAERKFMGALVVEREHNRCHGMSGSSDT